jgi:hypothetical protein
MSMSAFQSALTRMVSEPGFRDRVRRDGTALDGDLTLREQRRLRQAAGDPGVRVTSVLVSSFRLGKVLFLMPLTRTLLGDSRLALELKAFWATQPPRSFYAVDECLAFCDFLLAQPRRQAYTDDVVRLERTVLSFRRVRPEGAPPPPPQEVRFRHDPEQLFGALLAGRRPRRVRQRPCLLLASMAPDGTLDWTPVGRLPEGPAGPGGTGWAYRRVDPAPRVVVRG